MSFFLSRFPSVCFSLISIPLHLSSPQKKTNTNSRNVQSPNLQQKRHHDSCVLNPRRFYFNVFLLPSLKLFSNRPQPASSIFPLSFIPHRMFFSYLDTIAARPHFLVVAFLSPGLKHTRAHARKHARARTHTYTHTHTHTHRGEKKTGRGRRERLRKEASPPQKKKKRGRGGQERRLDLF